MSPLANSLEIVNGRFACALPLRSLMATELLVAAFSVIATSAIADSRTTRRIAFRQPIASLLSVRRASGLVRAGVNG
jgi:hypothetical protein